MTELEGLPVTLRPSRTKHSLLLLVSVAFTALGVWMVHDGEKMGYWVGGFFALLIVIFVVNMLPGASYLRLDREGFTFCSLFRSHTVRWADVKEFGVMRIQMNKMVAWNSAPGYVSAHPQRLRGVNQALSGFDAALPDTYGLSAIELAAKMAVLREQFGPKDPDDMNLDFPSAEWNEATHPGSIEPK